MKKSIRLHHVVRSIWAKHVTRGVVGLGAGSRTGGVGQLQHAAARAAQARLAATVEKAWPLICTVRVAVDQAGVPDCRITLDTKVMRLEEQVNKNQKRDWRQGMATVGRTKECTSHKSSFWTDPRSRGWDELEVQITGPGGKNSQVVLL